MLQNSYDQVEMDDKYACGDLEVIFGKCSSRAARESEPETTIGTLLKKATSVEYYPPGPSYQEYLDKHNIPTSQPKETIQKEWANVASLPPPLTSYYAVGGIEVIDYIKAKLTQEQYKGYLLGNIYKYSGRLQYKGEETKDITKLVEYAGWLKEHNVNNS